MMIMTMETHVEQVDVVTVEVVDVTSFFLERYTICLRQVKFLAKNTKKCYPDEVAFSYI